MNGTEVEIFGEGPPQTHVLVPEEALIQTLVDQLPSPDELQRWIAAAVVSAVKDIVTGRLKYKSAAEATRSIKDLVDVASKLKWENAAASLAAAKTDEERLEALKAFQKKADDARRGLV